MDEFTKALNEEFDLAPDEETTAVAVEEPPKVEDDKPETPPVEEPKVEEPTDEPEPTAEETPVETQYATKDDIKAAMREYNSETTERVEAVQSVASEVISEIYPEGVDTTIYDSNGVAIKTAQDIVDRGLLKADGEPFTYEEAASWMMAAQQQMNQNLSELKDYATYVAARNISLSESSKRVMDKWGDVINTLPKEERERLAAKYMEGHLEFAKNGNFITKMSMTPEDFYDIALSPYRQLNQALAEKKALEEQMAQRQAQAEQAERSGLPQRGQSRTKANTGDPMLDALIDEMEKE